MDKFLVGNRGGIVYVNASQTNAGSATTNAIYTLPDHTFRYLGPVGLLIVHVDTEATGILGLTVQVNNQTLVATNNVGEALTDVTAGDHMMFFNKSNNTIKLFV